MTIVLPYGQEDLRAVTWDEVLVLHPEHNSHGRNDVGGAFKPEAEAFCDLHGIPHNNIYTFDNSRSYRSRAEIVLSLLEEEPRVVVGFMHGWTHGIQCGIRCNMHPKFGPRDKPIWEKFETLLSKHHNVHVLLYACSTGNDPDDDKDTAPGSGEDSFADVLRDDLCWEGSIWCRVVAHTTAGHTTHNPWLKFFDGKGSPYGGVGAELIFPPRDRRGRFSMEWKTLKKQLETNFRFQFPFMRVVDIHRHIRRLIREIP